MDVVQLVFVIEVGIGAIAPDVPIAAIFDFCTTGRAYAIAKT